MKLSDFMTGSGGSDAWSVPSGDPLTGIPATRSPFIRATQRAQECLALAARGAITGRDGGMRMVNVLKDAPGDAVAGRSESMSIQILRSSLDPVCCASPVRGQVLTSLDGSHTITATGDENCRAAGVHRRHVDPQLGLCGFWWPLRADSPVEQPP
jgi:hypothetical protein